MRVGIDASCWANRRGYGRYSRELLRALFALDRGNEYVLFLDEPTAERSVDLPSSPRIKQVVVKTTQAAADGAAASGHRAWRDVWAMSRAVSRQARMLDVFFFPSVYTFYPIRTPAKVVVTIHDTIAERNPRLIFPTWRSRLFWTAKVRWSLWQADLVATVSEAARAAVLQVFRLAPSRVRVIPDAVSPVFRKLPGNRKIPDALARFGVSEDEPYLLYVGGISPHKNLSTLVEAFAAARAETSRAVKLVLVGDIERDVFYSSYTAVRDQVERLALSGAVIFTGFLPDAELVAVYNAATALVLPSFDEGFGLPAVEAMACGTPVIASRIPVLQEVVSDAGLFFDPTSPAELRSQLSAMLDNVALRRALGGRGVRRAQGFTWRRSAEAALAVFQELNDLNPGRTSQVSLGKGATRDAHV